MDNDLLRLTSYDIIGFICPINDADLAEIILKKEINGFCIKNMTPEYRDELFPTGSLRLKYNALVNDLVKINSTTLYALPNNPIQNKSSINILSPIVNTYSISNNSACLDQNNLENGSNEMEKSNNEESDEDSDDTDCTENEKILKNWTGFFEINSTEFNLSLRKKLKNPNSQMEKKRFR